MYWIDTHLHFGEHMQEIPSYMEECRNAGVKSVILCAGSKEDALQAKDLAGKYPEFFYAVGVHPHEAVERKEFAASFREYLSDPKMVACGEIGLDYYYDFTPHEAQKELLTCQLEYALEAGLPAILHCRDKENTFDAYEDAYPILRSFADRGGRYVLHCYAGTPEYAKKFLDTGAFFGVGGMITFNKAENIRSLAQYLPLDRLLVETDAPYLAPKPHRGKPNHSKYIPLIGEKLASVKGILPEECQASTTENALTLFGPRLKNREQEE